MFTDKKIRAKIVEFREDKAILELGSDKIEWPASKLPQGKGIGDVVVLEAKAPEKTVKKDKVVAKEIINQILNP